MLWVLDNYEANDFFELQLWLVLFPATSSNKSRDAFTHPKTRRTSLCYRITYRSMDRPLTDVEINTLQDTLRDRAAEDLNVDVRLVCSKLLLEGTHGM